MRRRAILASLLVAAPALAQTPTPTPSPQPAPVRRGRGGGTRPPATAPQPNPGGRSTLPPPSEQGPVETPVHKEGEYGGVDPGKSAPATDGKPKFKRPPPKGTLSWIGFEAKDGGAQVFFQSPGPFDITQSVDNGVLYVYLSNLNRLGANEWRAIDTRYFDNPLARLEARIVGAGKGHPAGVQVKVVFKNVKDAHEGSFKSQQEADGFYYTYLTFGEGTGDKTEPTVTEPEK